MHGGKHLFKRGNGFFVSRVSDADGSLEAQPIMYFDTLLRYHLHIDPNTLSDEEWAITIKQLEDIRKAENKENK